MRIPKYRHWKTRDKGFVEYQGKRTYFPGRYKSPESLEAYQAWIAKHLHTQQVAERAAREALTMSDLAACYLQHATSYYGSGSRGTIVNIRAAIRSLLEADQGDLLAVDYGPRQLKALQGVLISQGLARRTINDRTAWVKAMAKWGVSEELIPPDVHQALSTVSGLARGRSAAKDPPQRQPASWVDVEATLAELSPVLRSMVLLQWFSGARSGSICQARPEQFEHDRDLLLWRPRHKTEWRGRELILPLGPQAQEQIAPYLERRPYCFSPREASGRGGERYQPWTYRRAIVRAQERAQAGALQRGERAPQPWTPHQLRHARAHLVRERFGVEAAQAILGHDSLEATQLYSQRRLELAREVARSIG